MPARPAARSADAGAASGASSGTPELLRGLHALESLADEWDELHAQVPTATPFQRHAWVTAWARSYAARDDVRVTLVRHEGRLQAAAAWHLVGRGPWRVLRPLGGAQSDVTEVLAVAGVEPWAAFLAALRRDRSWIAVDLPEVHPGSQAEALARRWPGRSLAVRSSTSLVLPVGPLPELLARVPARTASTLRRKLRKVEALGVDVRELGPAEVPAGIDRLLALHQAQWRGRGGNPEHLSRRFHDHLVEAVTAMTAQGCAALREFEVDGVLVMAQVVLHDHGDFDYYLAGIAPDLRDRIDTSVLLVTQDLLTAQALGAHRYSMLRGEEDYKTRWRPDRVTATRWALARPDRPTGLAVLGAVGLDRRLRDTVKRHLPALRSNADRVRHPARWLRSLSDRRAA
ncbi:MAG: hypothetical protein JWQ53_2772 [Klenkia sp.]|nr:hypothetical protein [Klenkia sp.]